MWGTNATLPTPERGPNILPLSSFTVPFVLQETFSRPQGDESTGFLLFNPNGPTSGSVPLECALRLRVVLWGRTGRDVCPGRLGEPGPCLGGRCQVLDDRSLRSTL